MPGRCILQQGGLSLFQLQISGPPWPSLCSADAAKFCVGTGSNQPTGQAKTCAGLACTTVHTAAISKQDFLFSSYTLDVTVVVLPLCLHCQ
jgi:hypothetical protein